MPTRVIRKYKGSGTLKWSNSSVKPAGVFLDDDLASVNLANYIRTNVTPLVLSRHSRDVGKDIKDEGIREIACHRDLLIVARNKGSFPERRKVLRWSCLHFGEASGDNPGTGP